MSWSTFLLAEACGFTGELLGFKYTETEVLSVLAAIFSTFSLELTYEKHDVGTESFFYILYNVIESAAHCNKGF